MDLNHQICNALHSYLLQVFARRSTKVLKIGADFTMLPYILARNLSPSSEFSFCLSGYNKFAEIQTQIGIQI